MDWFLLYRAGMWLRANAYRLHRVPDIALPVCDLGCWLCRTADRLAEREIRRI